jgi:hypothetical protein
MVIFFILYITIIIALFLFIMLFLRKRMMDLCLAIWFFGSAFINSPTFATKDSYFTSTCFMWLFFAFGVYYLFRYLFVIYGDDKVIEK